MSTKNSTANTTFQPFQSNQKTADNSHNNVSFKSEAYYLDLQLTNRLKEANDDINKKLAAADETFTEVIQKDQHFGKLLTKIKHAYEEYVRMKQDSTLVSPSGKPSYEELEERVHGLESQLIQEKEKRSSLEKDLDLQNTACA